MHSCRHLHQVPYDGPVDATMVLQYKPKTGWAYLLHAAFPHMLGCLLVYADAEEDVGYSLGSERPDPSSCSALAGFESS